MLYVLNTVLLKCKSLSLIMNSYMYTWSWGGKLAEIGGERGRNGLFPQSHFNE